MDPDTGAVLPTWGEALDELDADPHAAAGARAAVRVPAGHQGPARRQRGCGPGGALPVQVPDQGHRRHLHPRPGTRGPGVRGAHRPAARAGAVVAVLVPVRQLAAVRHPTRAAPGPAWSRVSACRRRTTGRTSAWGAGGCSSRGRGPARPSPNTGPTAPTWCEPRWRPPGSTRRKRAGWPPTPSTTTGRRGTCGQDVPVQDRNYTAVLTSMIRQARAWREQYEQAKTVAAADGRAVDRLSAVAGRPP